MDRRLVYAGAGFLLAWWIFHQRQRRAEYIEVGDKGKDVAGLQDGLNKVFGAGIQNVGVYDKKTGKVVADVFKGTGALVDPGTGKIKREFTQDFSIIAKKL